jgi:hypothetical protein
MFYSLYYSALAYGVSTTEHLEFGINMKDRELISASSMKPSAPAQTRLSTIKAGYMCLRPSTRKSA